MGLCEPSVLHRDPRGRQVDSTFCTRAERLLLKRGLLHGSYHIPTSHTSHLASCTYHA